MHIIDRCSDTFGRLSTANRTLLRSLLRQPTEEAWIRAKSIVICPLPLMTLNMAVHRISHRVRPAHETPDAFTLYRAIKYSLDKHAQFLQRPEVSDIES